MSKIIYLKQEVKLGEIIIYQGLGIEVTQTLIDNNPDIFKVIDERVELLDKAKRDYPAGTVFRGLFGDICTVKKKPLYSISNRYSSIRIDGIYVYRDGEWAEILPLKFTTEDGVDIYGDMKTWMVYPKDSDDIRFSHGTWDGNSVYKGYKHFYHKENALAYIEKHKEKTFEDYENLLIKSKSFRMVDKDGIETILETRHFYQYLKEIDPKLYYTKVLQLIADDLNDGWVADFSDYEYKWFIKDDTSVWTMMHDYGIVLFKTKEVAEKARVILGDKVKYLFNKNK